MNMTIRATAAPASQSPLVSVFDGNKSKPLTPEQVASSKDAVLRETVKNASDVMAFLKSEFGRNGLDGKGQQLKLVVHAPDEMGGGPMNNAYWDGRAGTMFIGDGDGKMFTPLGLAKDIVAHEAGHAVLESEIKMGFKGEQGALHESFGDVLGALVDNKNWQIGEDAYTPGTKGDALRDMSKPANYKHMSDVANSKTTEPHDLADIPNLAAVRVAEKIGRSEMGKVWFEGFTKHLNDNASFTDAASATLKAAEMIFGAGSSQASAVTDAWTSVGVLEAASNEAPQREAA